MTSSTDLASHRVNLIELPGIGRFLRWRHARTAVQLPLLLVSLLMVFDGLTGPQLAPKNLATVLTWVHYRGLVVLALLLAGNLFCMACPFMLVRNLTRRLQGTRAPTRLWPRRLRHKWLALALFVFMLFAYELFDLWAAPRWTAMLILVYFAAALLVDSLFRGAAFCKYLCPLGQFNFIASLISPLEVTVASLHTCTTCRTKDCIKGRSQPQVLVRESQVSNLEQVVSQSEGSGTGPEPKGKLPNPQHQFRGCELWLFQPRKTGNMDCTFCLDCVHACPHDNVGILSRLPASELWIDRWRSGIGRFSRRPDLAALVSVFVFGSLLNAFAMVTPVYALEDWLALLLGTQSEVPVLALIFLIGLVIVPAVLLGLAGMSSWRWAGASDRWTAQGWITRYIFALVPIGFGVWLAHYAFHFLTGFWTFLPVVQSFVADIIGAPLLGEPLWRLGSLLPATWLYPLEIGFLALGWFGTLLVAHRLSETEGVRHPWRAFIPWAVLTTLLLAVAIWLMGQPMEMRGTFMAG